MKTVWLIELRNTHPVLYWRGVSGPEGGTLFIFVTDANEAGWWKTKKEAEAFIKKELTAISNMLVAVEHSFE